MPEPVFGNEKGHTLFEYGLENLAPQRGWIWALGGKDIPLILLIRNFQLVLKRFTSTVAFQAITYPRSAGKKLLDTLERPV